MATKGSRRYAYSKTHNCNSPAGLKSFFYLVKEMISSVTLLHGFALTVGAMTSIHVFALVLIGAVHNLNTFDDTCVTWETTGACEFRGEIKL